MYLFFIDQKRQVDTIGSRLFGKSALNERLPSQATETHGDKQRTRQAEQDQSGKQILFNTKT